MYFGHSIFFVSNETFFTTSPSLSCHVLLPPVCLLLSKMYLCHYCLNLPEWPWESRTGATWLFIGVEGTSWRETNLWCKLLTPTQLSLYPLSRCYRTSRKPQECLHSVSCFSNLVPALHDPWNVYLHFPAFKKRRRQHFIVSSNIRSPCQMTSWSRNSLYCLNNGCNGNTAIPGHICILYFI